MNINFIGYSKVYYFISGVLIFLSIFFLASYGLKFGIEFTGGSIMELQFANETPSTDSIRSALASFDLGEVVIQPTENKGVILKFRGVDEDTHQKIKEAIGKLASFEEKRFDFIGPSIGEELKKKTELAIVLALLAITLYISFAFRKVSRPIQSYKYGITSLIALFHDILIPLGVFALLGKI